jgi:hypothetical protein
MVQNRIGCVPVIDETGYQAGAALIVVVLTPC